MIAHFRILVVQQAIEISIIGLFQQLSVAPFGPREVLLLPGFELGCQVRGGGGWEAWDGQRGGVGGSLCRSGSVHVSLATGVSCPSGFHVVIRDQAHLTEAFVSTGVIMPGGAPAVLAGSSFPDFDMVFQASVRMAHEEPARGLQDLMLGCCACQVKH